MRVTFNQLITWGGSEVKHTINQSNCYSTLPLKVASGVRCAKIDSNIPSQKFNRKNNNWEHYDTGRIFWKHFCFNELHLTCAQHSQHVHATESVDLVHPLVATVPLVPHDTIISISNRNRGRIYKNTSRLRCFEGVKVASTVWTTERCLFSAALVADLGHNAELKWLFRR